MIVKRETLRALNSGCTGSHTIRGRLIALYLSFLTCSSARSLLSWFGEIALNRDFISHALFLAGSPNGILALTPGLRTWSSKDNEIREREQYPLPKYNANCGALTNSILPWSVSNDSSLAITWGDKLQQAKTLAKKRIPSALKFFNMKLDSSQLDRQPLRCILSPWPNLSGRGAGILCLIMILVTCSCLLHGWSFLIYKIC